MLPQNKPIGIFDSGVGGTSIWKEISLLLPYENTIYLSDSKNAPYGDKSKKKIVDLCIKNIDFLLSKNCKLIVVACNTATTNAISILRKKYEIPLIGIEPAIKTASLTTKTNKIGILATKGTLSSALFEKTLNSINQQITTKEVVGDGLVELIEKGKLYSEEMSSLLETYISPMVNQNIDCLVLGCTHYPYLIPQIKKIVGNKTQIIDASQAIARQTKKILKTNFLLQNSTGLAKHIFYINKPKKTLKKLLFEHKNCKIIEKDF